MRIQIISFFLALALLADFGATAQASANLYILSIGSADYESDFSLFEEGFDGWPPVPSAAYSARQFNKIFSSSQVAHIDSLISSPDQLISREAILTAVDRIIVRAKLEKKQSPLILFYFAGHGVSEGFGWNLFLIPGDFISKIEEKGAADMSEVSVYAGDVYDKLEQAKLPFAMMLDCCYEGKDESGTLKVLSYQEEFKQTAQLAQFAMLAVRKLNEFEDQYPVVFSAEPGKLAETVPLPNTNDDVRVGPVCRRAILASNTLGDKDVTLELVLSTLTSKALDSEPRSFALTNWIKENCNFRQYKIK